MRKHITTKKLSRNRDERKHLQQGLVADLVLKERIVTTLAKGQFAKILAEKLVTAAKDNTRASRQLLLSRLPQEEIVRKLLVDIAPRFASRAGGYTRMLKMGRRAGDGAQQVLLEWVEKKPEEVKAEVVHKPKTRRSPVSPARLAKQAGRPESLKSPK